MTDIRKLAKQNGRSLPWIARERFGITRQRLYQKIDADDFTPEQRETLAYELGVTVADLFPDIEPEEVTV